MLDLSLIIKKYRYSFYKSAGNENGKPAPCPHYAGGDRCSRKEGGFCKKLAEIRGNIDYVIPSEYRDLTIENASGIIVSKDGVEQHVWSEDNRLEIQNTLRNYLFGGVDRVLLTGGRESYNKYSQMDKRFSDGDAVIIHGDNLIGKKEGKQSPRFLPAGKTMIACLILKEAIWRKLFATNRADTYSVISYQTLKQDLKLRTERSYDLKECDWLCIDDISLPLREDDFNHQQFVTLFDDFLMTRIEQKLPTILVCSFDVLAKDYTHSLGYTFQKMVSSKNSWLISVGGGK